MAKNNLKPRINKETIMPYVNIRLAGSLTREQKADLSQKVTEAIVTVTGKPKETVLIFIDEVERQNIAKGGCLLDELK